MGVTAGEDPPRDEAALLQAVAVDGDQVAFKVLYDRHAPWLEFRLRHWRPHAEVIEEVVQDTFLAVWRSANAWRGEGEVAAWIWGIARHRLLDAMRPPSKIWALTQLVANTVLDGRGRANLSAEDELLRDVDYSDLSDALRTLSPELRNVVWARVLDGFSVRETARLLELPEGTVKSRLSRACRQLRDELTRAREELP